MSTTKKEGIVDREEKNYMKNIKRGMLWGVLLTASLAIARKVRKDSAAPFSLASVLAIVVSSNVVSFGIDIAKGENLLGDDM